MNAATKMKPLPATTAADTPLSCASLDVLPGSSRDQFAAVARRQPVLLDGRDCWSGWDDDVLSVLRRHYGERSLSEMRTLYGLPAQVRRAKWVDPATMGPIYELIAAWTVDDYLAASARGEAPFYLANLALGQFPEIKRRYTPPRIGPRNLVRFSERASAPELFVGSANTQYSHLHVDAVGGSVWCVCLYGEKEWIVFPPGDSEKLRPFREGSLGQLRQSMLDPWDPRSCAEFPVRELHPYRVRLQAGQALFLPPNWWHITRNNGLTVTINERAWSWSTLRYFAPFLWHELKGRALPGTPQPYVLY